MAVLFIIPEFPKPNIHYSASTPDIRNGKGCVRKMLVNFGATLSISGKCALSFEVVRVNTEHISRTETAKMLLYHPNCEK